MAAALRDGVLCVTRSVLAPMIILLVEDDPDSLDVTAYALQREGFDIITAGSGHEALQCWRAEQPDMVVLEAGLPGLSGFEVCRQIREQGSTPVILLSDQTTRESLVQAFRVGADDWVTKPCSPDELAVRIRAVWRWVVEDLG